MTPVTGKTPGNGTSTLSYAIPAAGLDVESVYASIDTTGAAGAVTAELTIADQSGAVIARKVQNTTIDQGIAGSATWALQLLDDCLTTPVNPGYPDTVLSIASTGTLRGYWRLGDLASPFLDISGYVGGPTDLSVHATGIAYTTHVTGALPPAQDDGALQFNAPVNGGYYIDNGAVGLFTGSANTFSVAAWAKPFSSGSAWIGAVFSNEALVAGSPNHLEGWLLGCQWTGTGVNALMGRIVNSVGQSAVIAVSPDAWSFLVGTYDGTTSRLYVNGSLAATHADARPLGDALGDPTIGQYVQTIGGTLGQFYGVIDEVAFWSTTLTPTQVATLYAAGV